MRWLLSEMATETVILSLFFFYYWTFCNTNDFLLTPWKIVFTWKHIGGHPLITWLISKDFCAPSSPLHHVYFYYLKEIVLFFSLDFLLGYKNFGFMKFCQPPPPYPFNPPVIYRPPLANYIFKLKPMRYCLTLGSTTRVLNVQFLIPIP